MDPINLDILNDSFMGLTPEIGSYMRQACIVCLDSQSHKSGAEFSVNDQKTLIQWAQEVDDKIMRNWRDLQEATEYGASAISVLLAERETNYTCLERSSKGSGFDYYLGDEDDFGIFQHKAKLEISGILSETKTNTVKQRVKEKKDQVDKYAKENMQAHICVTAFSAPKAIYQITK